MRAVYGLYADPDLAQRAVDLLRREGVQDREIAVISSEPFEEYEFSHRDHATWMYWIAGAGGAVAFALATWFISVTQQSWPLNTGGMPIVTPPTNAIVIFEVTMLGAILATVATLIVSARIPSLGRGLYDPEVTNGYILVGVENPPEGSAGRLAAALESVGPGQVKITE